MGKHQRVVHRSNDQYVIFAYHIAPTYDFIMELRKFGSKLEVLEPASLREKFRPFAEILSGSLNIVFGSLLVIFD